jgi:hypothetical protein
VSFFSYCAEISPFLILFISRADTLYLCYCIDKVSGDKRREEVFIAFEYDSASAPTGHPSRQPETPVARPPVPISSRRKDEETLFDVEELGNQRKGGSRPLPTPQQSQRGPRTTPLSPYLDAEYEEMSTTPTARGKGRKESIKPAKISEEEEEEDLDPFRRSMIDDEEAQIRMATRVNPVGMKSPTAVVPGLGHVARPSLVGIGLADQGLAQHLPGHQRASSGGGGPKRMLSSTQELNMKSQFLMNMRPYGVEESQGSEMEMNASIGRESNLAGSRGGKGEEDSLSEGEESQLGPGSDFFK